MEENKPKADSAKRSKVLTEKQINFFRDNGYLCPFEGISQEDASVLCDDLAEYEKTSGHNATKIITKSHLLFPDFA